MRWLTAGESHGPALVAILEGMPAGVEVSSQDVRDALARRRLGYGRGARQKFEQDELDVLGGLRHGRTLGSPIALRIGNSEWPKWETVMSPDPVPELDLAAAHDVNAPKEIARNRPLTRPRPGHADLVGMQKYGFDEARQRPRAGLGPRDRGPGRPRRLRRGLPQAGRGRRARLAHGRRRRRGLDSLLDLPLPGDVDALDEDPMRAHDADASAAMVAEVDAAHRDGDTLGGVVEVLAYGLPPGLGSHVHWDRRLDSRLAGALMGIQAIKGVELGDGFVTATRRGSAAHDEMARDEAGTIRRATGRAGGTEGGMSTGEVLRVRAAMKPISTVPRALATVDVTSGEAAQAIHQRSDVCAVPAAGVVAEAMVALVLADCLLEKFGGDSVAETARNVQAYLAAIPEGMRTW